MQVVVVEARRAAARPRAARTTPAHRAARAPRTSARRSRAAASGLRRKRVGHHRRAACRGRPARASPRPPARAARCSRPYSTSASITRPAPASRSPSEGAAVRQQQPGPLDVDRERRQHPLGRLARQQLGDRRHLERRARARRLHPHGAVGRRHPEHRRPRSRACRDIARALDVRVDPRGLRGVNHLAAQGRRGTCGLGFRDPVWWTNALQIVKTVARGGRRVGARGPRVRHRAGVPRPVGRAAHRPRHRLPHAAPRRPAGRRHRARRAGGVRAREHLRPQRAVARAGDPGRACIAGSVRGLRAETDDRGSHRARGPDHRRERRPEHARVAAARHRHRHRRRPARQPARVAAAARPQRRPPDRRARRPHRRAAVRDGRGRRARRCGSRARASSTPTSTAPGASCARRARAAG